MSKINWKIFQRFPFRPKRRVGAVFAGQFESRFKGEGQEFYGLRPYERGDDSRKIHWQQFAKTGELVFREDIAERNIRIWIMWDLSPSMDFGAKPDLIEGFSLFVDYLSRDGNNFIGGIGFSDEIHILQEPRTGRAANRFMERIKTFKEAQKKGREAHIGHACAHLAKHMRLGDVIFFVSDFFSKENLVEEFHVFAWEHEFIPVVVRDPLEGVEVPEARISFKDMETQRVLDVFVDNSLKEHDLVLKKTFQKFLFDVLWLEGKNFEDAVEIIVRWLYSRKKR